MISDLLFAEYRLDTTNRQLWRGEEPVELNPRYLDALILLVNSRGQLLNKQRFYEEVWSGTVVSDDALTQCIRVLRKILGDSASHPRFIETLPKHGYRFIAEVKPLPMQQDNNINVSFITIANPSWRMFTGGLLGAAIAGIGGGVVYASIVINLLQGDLGQLSVLFVMITLSLMLALLGGAAISTALVLTRHYSASLIIGTTALASGLLAAMFNLIGIDTLQLLFGHYPKQITGMLEGLLLGAAVASAFLLAKKRDYVYWQIAAFSAVLGILAGLVINASGGQLMTGSMLHLGIEFQQSLLNKLVVFSEQNDSHNLIYFFNIVEASWFTFCMCFGLLLGNKAPQTTKSLSN